MNPGLVFIGGAAVLFVAAVVALAVTNERGNPCPRCNDRMRPTGCMYASGAWWECGTCGFDAWRGM